MLTQDRSIPHINTHLFRFDFQSPLYDLQKQDDLSPFTTAAQIFQQYWGEGSVLAATKEEVVPFLVNKLSLSSKLFKSKEELAIFIKKMAQIQQSQMPTPQLSSPSTSASPIAIPSPSKVQM
ncbi:hypothetical protein [Rickettsiella massiliensis]|uniref:hypothetical protein n=1 Tax=Rickettsiella massiliensis TaxID=676517 RepID=UPI00029B0CAD|nr:hypothetical protein [Rickettsiella massiliensis]